MRLSFSQPRADALVVVLDGSLDMAGTEAATAPLIAALAKCRNAIIDLANVTFLGSVGIRLLITAAKNKASVGGTLVLLNPGPMPKRVLEVSGTDGIIPVFKTTEDALASFT